MYAMLHGTGQSKKKKLLHENMQKCTCKNIYYCYYILMQRISVQCFIQPHYGIKKNYTILYYTYTKLNLTDFNSNDHFGKYKSLVSRDTMHGICFLSLKPGMVEQDWNSNATLRLTRVISCIISSSLPYLVSISHRLDMNQDPLAVFLQA